MEKITGTRLVDINGVPTYMHDVRSHEAHFSYPVDRRDYELYRSIPRRAVYFEEDEDGDSEHAYL